MNCVVIGDVCFGDDGIAIIAALLLTLWGALCLLVNFGYADLKDQIKAQRRIINRLLACVPDARAAGGDDDQVGGDDRGNAG